MGYAKDQSMQRGRSTNGTLKHSKRNPFGASTARPQSGFSFDNDLLHKAVAATVANGGLVSFSRTRDGGAVCITILVDDDKYRTYCANDAELRTALEGVIEFWGTPPKKLVLEEVDIP